MKQIAAYFGGTRQGTVISWPKRINDKEGIREQFCHVIDIVPTILEACGIPEPVSVNGVPQTPIEGTSMVYTFDKANAKAKSKHTTQYFEMLGNCALYHEGWIASAVPFAAPWDLAAKSPKDMLNGVKWELYDLTKDFSQYEDVAKANPEKLQLMKDLFMAEAAKHNVFPLDGSKSERFAVPRPSVTAGRTQFVYTKPGVSIPTGDAPNQMNRSFSITAEVEIPKEGAEGMLLTHGGRFGGYGLYLLKGRPVFTYNFVDLERTKWEGKDALTPGKHTIVYDFTHDPNTKGAVGPFGKGGLGVLTVDGKVVAQKVIQRTIPLIMTWDETFDIGQDLRTPVDDNDYQCPFPFTGTLTKVTMNLEPLQLGPIATAEFQKKTQQPPD
jgi:arylsulfatase